MSHPIFVSVEGADGSGKTTLAAALQSLLEQRGHPCTLVREPGTTPLGDHVRQYLRDNQPLTPEAELMLFLAARAQLVQSVIQPALRQGQCVITDRYTDSSIAYQGHGRGLPVEQIENFNRFVTGGLTPHITILLDTDPETARQRSTHPSERYEGQDDAFHQAVRQGYTQLAQREPSRVLTLNAAQSPQALADEALRAVLLRLELIQARTG